MLNTEKYAGTPDFGYSFRVTARTGRDSTCDISTWDAFYLAVVFLFISTHLHATEQHRVDHTLKHPYNSSAP